MGDEAQITSELQSCAQQRQEKTGLEQRFAVANDRIAATEQLVASTRAQLDDEAAGVDKLESFSPTRIWASLKGSRTSDLDREIAERDAAKYAVAHAEAQRDVAVRERDSLQSQLAELGDVEARYAAALGAKDAWLRSNSSSAAPELAEIAERKGILTARDTESREAYAAGLAAHDLLTHAQQLFGGARSWSTWDTFGGGGLLTDMAKYDKIDQATAVISEANAAVSAFTRELADIDLGGIEGVQIDTISKGFDMFFDNIFTDMSVRSRITDAAAHVDQALAAVAATLGTVATSGRQIIDELIALDARREQLLLSS